MTSKPAPFDIIITHGNCFDGFTSAWAAWLHSPNAEHVFAQYGDPPPDVAGKRVLIADFSYPREVLLRMHEDAADLLVLDHHKTAAADLDGLDFTVFDLHRSGAGITWDVLHPEVTRPPLVDHVEDRDLWKFALDGTRAVHAALSSYAFDFNTWSSLATRPITRLKEEGRTILGFVMITAEKFAARAQRRVLVVCEPCPEDGPYAGYYVELDRIDVWAVNVPVEFVSETAEILKCREPHLPILGWSWDGHPDGFYCSLRSRDDGPDVSAIAKVMGGGGHEHAAGFRHPNIVSLLSIVS